MKTTAKYLILIHFLGAGLIGCSNPKNYHYNHTESTFDKSDSTLGPISSGGGGVCVEDKTNKMQFFDLWEASNAYKINILRSDTPHKDQIKTALQHIQDSHLRNLILDKTKDVLTHIKIGVSPKTTNDVDSPIRLCEGYGQYQQLAFYLGDSNIFVSKSLWGKLGQTDIAAFILHEAIYSLYRDMNFKTSLTARKLVGQLFSNHLSRKVYPTRKLKDHLNCSSKDGFYRFNINMNHEKWRLTFLTLGGEFALMGKSIALDTPILLTPSSIPNKIVNKSNEEIIGSQNKNLWKDVITDNTTTPSMERILNFKIEENEIDFGDSLSLKVILSHYTHFKFLNLRLKHIAHWNENISTDSKFIDIHCSSSN